MSQRSSIHPASVRKLPDPADGLAFTLEICLLRSLNRFSLESLGDLCDCSVESLRSSLRICHASPKDLPGISGASIKASEGFCREMSQILVSNH